MTTTILWLANEALFLTNLFVFTYKILLTLLNRFFPFVVNPNFFSQELFAPEPFEIPLYLGLTLIYVISIFILNKLISNNQETRNKKYSIHKNSKFKLFDGLRFGNWNLFGLLVGWKLGFLFFIFLLIIFFINIGGYPMVNNTQFIENLVDPVTSVFILVAYLIIVALVIITTYSLRRSRILLSLFLLIAIALFTFEPGFPSSAHDVSFFLGPIFEVAQGKTIYTSTSSFYGFVSILVLGFLTQLHLFNPFYLPFLTWLLYILQYFLGFYIIFRSSKSIMLALLGLFSILTVGYFSLFHLPNTFPQIGPMRWLPLIISLFLVQRYKNLTNSKLILLFSLLSLWNIEAGIALFLSYAFTLFLLIMVGAVSMRKVISSIVLFLALNLTLFIILDIIHILLGRQTIDFIGMFARLREFAVAGVAMIPMPWRTHFWLVLLIYFSTIIYVFKTINNKQLTILLFSANLSLFASVYFVGRSHPHNLFHISLFFLLNAFILIGLIKSEFIKIKYNKYSYFIFYILFFIFFIVYPAFNRRQALATMIKTKIDRLQIKSIFKPELEEQVKKFYSIEALLIKESLPQDELLILSVDDTYLFYLVDKKNLLLDNPQSGIASVSKADLNLALEKAYKICPQKMAASCSLFGICPKYQTFNHEAINIQKVLLESLEKSCKVEYKPLKCTNKLCIAGAINN